MLGQSRPGRHRVVIVGGGFGRLRAAKALVGPPVEITLIDRTNHHLFQPLPGVPGTAQPAIQVARRGWTRFARNRRDRLIGLAALDSSVK